MQMLSTLVIGGVDEQLALWLWSDYNMYIYIYMLHNLKYYEHYNSQ